MTGEVILKELHRSLSSEQQKSTFKARTAADVHTYTVFFTYTCTHYLTCEVTVDWERVTRELVVTVSGESGSPYYSILWVRQRDISPLHLKHQQRSNYSGRISKWKFKD